MRRRGQLLEREREGRETVCLRGCQSAGETALRQLLGSSSREDQSLLYTWSEQRLTQKEGRRSEVVNPLNPEENLPSQEGHQEEEASRSGLDKGCRI